MKTLEEVKQEMLSRAMNRPLSKYSLKDSDGRIAVSSILPGNMHSSMLRMKLLLKAITPCQKDLNEKTGPLSNIGN